MSKEKVYDAKINPLMAQIIALCEQHKIAMVASFHIPSDTDDHLQCTTALVGGEFPFCPPIFAAARIAQGDNPLSVLVKTAAIMGGKKETLQ